MKRKRRLWIGLIVVVLAVAGIGVIRWYVVDRDVAVPGDRPPAPSAPPAPTWIEQAGPSRVVEVDAAARANPDGEADPFLPAQGSAADVEPDYGWPDGFELPLHIQVEVPEVPGEVAEPSAPIEDDESAGRSGDRLTKGPGPKQA